MPSTELNEQQFQAVNSNDPRILCLAGAGAGKTKTLVSRIIRLIKDGVDPSSILSLTFTNAAAFEMKERYGKAIGPDIVKGLPEFRTFHSFCYSLIVKDKDVRERIGYLSIPEICDDSTLKEIKESVKLTIGCKLSEKELDDSCVLLNKKDKEMRELYKKALRKEIKKRNVITFDIMCYNVCELFEKNDPCILKYKEKYKYIQVDEAQDSDPKQFRFVSSFPATTNFFFCADALQNIYQFRNCTNEFVKTLAASPDWTTIKLYKNYRSTINICEFANKFSTYASDEYRITMEGFRTGDDVEVIRGSYSSYNQPVDEDHLNQLIEKIKEHPAETAVLCRTNRECGCVKAALSEAGIECSSSNKTKHVLNYLESALSNSYMLDWLPSLLESKDYGDYIRLSSIEGTIDIQWFLRIFGDRPKVKKAAEKIVEIRNIAKEDIGLEEKFNKIVKILRIKSSSTFDKEKMDSPANIVKELRDIAEEKEDSKIYVGTIHSSKGLEYDTVYVMGVDDKMFQLGSEEMNNLYYVAMTRAKNHLIIFRR